MTTGYPTDRLAERMATRFIRTTYSVDADDLRQEAQLSYLRHMAHCTATYDEAKAPAGGSLDGWVTQRMRMDLSNYVYDAGSPVSYKHRRQELRNVRQVEHTEEHHEIDATVADAIEATDWRLVVRARLREVAAEFAELALPVLYGEKTQAQAARDAGVPPSAVSTAIHEVRDRIRVDRVLLEAAANVLGEHPMSRSWRDDERAQMTAAGYLSVAEAATLAKTSTDMVRRAVARGDVTGKRGGGKPGRQPLYVLASQWLGWVEAHRAELKERSPWL